MQYIVVVDIDISNPVITGKYETYELATNAAKNICKEYRGKAVVIDLCFNMSVNVDMLQSVTDEEIIEWINEQMTRN